MTGDHKSHPKELSLVPSTVKEPRETLSTVWCESLPRLRGE